MGKGPIKADHLQGMLAFGRQWLSEIWCVPDGRWHEAAGLPSGAAPPWLMWWQVPKQNGRMETHCLAGHVRLELRNVDTNYPFERSHRFAGIQPNSGFGDYSRLSCGVGDTQLGRRPGSRQGCLRGRHQPSSHGFPGSEPNSGHGDHSRLSCSAGDTQLGAGLC